MDPLLRRVDAARRAGFCALAVLTALSPLALTGCGAPGDADGGAWIATGGDGNRGDIAVIEGDRFIYLSPVSEMSTTPGEPNSTCGSTRFTLDEIERGPIDLTSTGGTDGYIVLATAEISEDQTSMLWVDAEDFSPDGEELGPGAIEMRPDRITIEYVPDPAAGDVTFVPADSDAGKDVIADACGEG